MNRWAIVKKGEIDFNLGLVSYVSTLRCQPTQPTRPPAALRSRHHKSKQLPPIPYLTPLYAAEYIQCARREWIKISPAQSTTKTFLAGSGTSPYPLPGVRSGPWPKTFTRHPADEFPGFTRPSFSVCSHPVPLPRRCRFPSLVHIRLLAWGRSGISTAATINAQSQ